MKTVQLPGLTVIFHRSDIAETIIDDNIEVTAPMVKEVHNFLESRLEQPFSLVCNWRNDFSIHRHALPLIGEMNGINSIAVFAASHTKEIVAESALSFPQKEPFEHAIFSTLEEALKWATQQQDHSES
ncbi:MAG: hypothetical protein HON68_06635 [Gammaproteobacteria bacterium]|jgi:hypothetical protein|nr:hypothetical protein [Gammaproteobacteria bacterium]MBT3489327.1 hypothetical protein [Gammaproteobacteria bacterium]MBT3718721.1 hypothetical protein [Gammaproteobacteria bacterium]MBT3893342.1 hypothetical protein [Gammaproteobacteria bacterium]MBT4299618.1 hypothetical protein [Gammaproteobacteria bacterium]